MGSIPTSDVLCRSSARAAHLSPAASGRKCVVARTDRGLEPGSPDDAYKKWLLIEHLNSSWGPYFYTKIFLKRGVLNKAAQVFLNL